MGAYLKIYIKKDKVGHVRYELNDGRGYKVIRGLSVSKPIIGNTIYEKGEEDSHEISIYDKDYYLPSDEIPLSREELVGAVAYTRENDEKDQNYNLVTNNCNDFTSGVLAAAGKDGCVGDYLTKEQKEEFHGSQGSDLFKCKIPNIVGEEVSKGAKIFKDNVRKTACTGSVFVNSYFRDGHFVEAYTRSCGRH